MNAPLDIDEALALLRKEGRQHSWRLALLAGLLVLGLISFAIGGRGIGMGQPIAVFPLITSLACIVCAAAAAPRFRSRATDALAVLDDVRAIGPLVEALPAALGGKQTAIIALLTRLLRRLEPEDRDLLTVAQRRALVDTLRNAYITGDTDFTIALIHGLEKIGADEALRVLQMYADASVINLSERRIVEKAAASLPSLRLQAERRMQSQTLLHPASPTQPQTLLRAAAGESTAPTELLRADIMRQMD